MADWYLFVTPVFVATIFLLLFLTNSLNKLLPNLSSAAVIVAVLLTFIVIAIFTAYISKNEWKNSKYVINKDKVTVIEQNKTKTYGMKGYTSMRLDRSLLQRLCSSGKITIFFLGGGSVELNNIDNPEKVLEKIESIVL